MTTADEGLQRELLAASRSGVVVAGPRVIDAALLRAVLLRPPGPTDHPTGQLHLQGATVVGDLDLRGSTMGVQLTLVECDVRGGINLLEASTPGLQLDRTTVRWVDAANCVFGLEVWLKESSFPYGVDFTDARVGGSMHLDGSVFGPEHRQDVIAVVPRGYPVRMRRLTIGGMLSAPRIDCRGTFDLASSRIGGDLELDGARLTAGSNADPDAPATALNAPDLHVGGSVTTDPGHDRGRRSIMHAERSGRDTGSARTPADPLEVHGRLYLPGVVAGGDVDLSAARLTVDPPARIDRRATGPAGSAGDDPAAALVLDRAEIRGNVELDRRFAAHGTVRMSGARIGGDLRFDAARFGVAEAAYALVADGVVVRGRITGTDAVVTGELCLQDARVQHTVDLQRARIAAPGANAVNLHRATVGGTVDCGQIEAHGSLRFADLTAGSLFVSGAELSDPCGSDRTVYRQERFDPALNLIGAQITGTVRGNPAPAGRPLRVAGRIGLRGAQVSRSVQFIDARVTEDEGLAVDASTLVCADLVLSGLDAVGGVRFADARISGDVDLTTAYLRWNRKSIAELGAGGRPSPSIDGGGAEIGGNAWFDGARAEGLVRLRRATVQRSVGMKDVAYGAVAIFRATGEAAAGERARLVGEAAAGGAYRMALDRGAGPDVAAAAAKRAAAFEEAGEAEFGLLALDLAGLSTPDLVVAPAQPLSGDVDLSRAVVISLTDNAHLWSARRLDLLGLEYQLHIDLDAEPGTADWATQIRRFRSTKILPPPSTRETVALPTGQLSQPYLQLAAVYRATGSDSVARRILFEMRKREWAQRTAAPPGPEPFARRVRRALIASTGFLYRITVGYGYRLQLALAWLAGLWLAGLVVFAVLAPGARPDPQPVLGADGRTAGCVVAADADPVAVQPGYCGRFVPGLYSMDLLVPVVDLGQKSAWHYRDTAMQIVSDILQVAGWILATAAATAALGLVGRAEGERR